MRFSAPVIGSSASPDARNAAMAHFLSANSTPLVLRQGSRNSAAQIPLEPNGFVTVLETQSFGCRQRSRAIQKRGCLRTTTKPNWRSTSSPTTNPAPLSIPQPALVTYMLTAR